MLMCIHPLASILSQATKDWNLISDKLQNWPRGLVLSSGFWMLISRFHGAVKDLVQHVPQRLRKPIPPPCHSQRAAQIGFIGSLLLTATAWADCCKEKPLGKTSLFQPDGTYQTAMSLALPLCPAGNLKAEKIHFPCAAHLPFWGALEHEHGLQPVRCFGVYWP